MSIQLTFLGTGTSAGVPMIGCACEVCTSTDPRDRRDRPGVMIRYDDTTGFKRTFLIDTTPDLRHQMIRHKVMRIDGVVYTHNHADHMFGIDDLRRFNAVMEQPIDIYAERRVLDYLHQTFNYIFESHKNVNQSFVAQLIPNEITAEHPFDLFGQSWLPLRLLHGRLPILGYKIGQVAYCTDCSSIPPETFPHLYDLDVLVIDALRYRHHPTHMTIAQALEIIEQIQPNRAYLIHMNHEIKHARVEPTLPEHVTLSFDNLVIESDA